jgi:hypothetical protein
MNLSPKILNVARKTLFTTPSAPGEKKWNVPHYQYPIYPVAIVS